MFICLYIFNSRTNKKGEKKEEEEETHARIN